ncbi:MAG TPA: hypothetical protein VFY73_21485 [Ideonella sp.]|uniref:hypothetical protein n=1 Tax=Ideonella sp. TaxID=1929293 RepID=UPI002E302EEF|nr:hypothetical protein [Ideonella sp.]HEX5686607.1 hypothetical protein [Ideonella sp.]
MLALLPQQIAPPTPAQAELTERWLTPLGDALQAYCRTLRAETDTVLAPQLPSAAGKPYPYGRCEEITQHLYGRLQERLRQPAHPVELALQGFAAAGGLLRSVWGVLREQYFQNALQMGTLYVDVSNDTVVVTKPPVEILPMEASGLVAVRDLAHFRQTAERYWAATLYANHLVPSLAPLLPLVSVSPGRLRPGLQSACDYMIELMRRDDFQQAEAWLRDGPPPPPDLRLARLPADLRPWTTDPRQEAVLACQRARAAGASIDPHWRHARVSDYLRLLRDPAAQTLG